MDKSKCRSCGADVFFCRTSTGNVGIYDYEPSDNGNTVLVDGVAVVLKGDLWEEHHGGFRYISHFATCPNAKAHHKSKK